MGHRRHVLKLLYSLGSEYEIIIKLHPRENIEFETRRIHKILPNAFVLGGDYKVHQLLSLADVIINRGNSQIALEAIWMDKPLIIIPQELETIFSKTDFPVVHTQEELSKAVNSFNNFDYSSPSADFINSHFYKTTQSVRSQYCSMYN